MVRAMSGLDTWGERTLIRLGWTVTHEDDDAFVQPPSLRAFYALSAAEIEAGALGWIAAGAEGQAEAPQKPAHPTPPRVVPSGRIHRDLARLQRLRKWFTLRRRPPRSLGLP